MITARPRALRLAAFVLLMIATSACQLTVQIRTTLDASGGGTFSIATKLDRELRT